VCVAPASICTSRCYFSGRSPNSACGSKVFTEVGALSARKSQTRAQHFSDFSKPSGAVHTPNGSPRTRSNPIPPSAAAEALRDAMLAYFNDPRNAYPSYWAPLPQDRRPLQSLIKSAVSFRSIPAVAKSYACTNLIQQPASCAITLAASGRWQSWALFHQPGL
jgi:hypothetical protein